MTKMSFYDANKVKNEAELHSLASQGCQYVLKFHEYILTPDYGYMILDYMPCGSLFYYIDGKEGLPEILALKFFYQTALAIEKLHSMSILHRDIKLENIMIH